MSSLNGKTEAGLHSIPYKIKPKELVDNITLHYLQTPKRHTLWHFPGSHYRQVTCPAALPIEVTFQATIKAP